MSRRLADLLNGLTDDALRAALTRCCGSKRWVSKMAGERPFANDAVVHVSAQYIWKHLGRDDWLEAFAAHPRIGEQAIEPWAQAEQAGTAIASPASLEALADGNQSYEQRFGHVFLICATGLSADEMLAELRQRIPNDPGKELEIAAGEQAKITRLRLEKLAAS